MTNFLCRHLFGWPCTARNRARARRVLENAAQCVFAFAVGFVCWLLVLPVIVMAMAL